jgi:hypothetical protein
MVFDPNGQPANSGDMRAEVGKTADAWDGALVALAHFLRAFEGPSEQIDQAEANRQINLFLGRFGEAIETAHGLSERMKAGEPGELSEAEIGLVAFLVACGNRVGSVIEAEGGSADV